MADVSKLLVNTGTLKVDVVDENGYSIGSFDFNIADDNIIKRYGNVVNFFTGADFDKNTPQEQITSQFDYLLGDGVSAGLFDKYGPLTITKNGDFFFEQVLHGVGALIESVTKKRLDKKISKVKKATD